MPNRIPWTARAFSFDHPADLFPELIERLRGAPARAEEVAASVPAGLLTRLPLRAHARARMFAD
ncbi:MAG: hypothetical protein ACYTGP_09890 [Planctomycetota bacterium]|jgi:hypothetical protein